MKVVLGAVSALMTGVLATASLSAATVTIRASGQISTIGARIGSDSVTIPAGDVALGDSYALEVRFETGTATPNPFFAGEPRAADYDLLGAHMALSIGSSFSDDFTQPGGVAHLLLFNGHPGFYDADGQELDVLHNGAPSSPFDLGAGTINQTSYLYAVDFDGLLRDNVDLNDLKDVKTYPFTLFTTLFMNIDTGLYVELVGTVDRSSIEISAVPEPASWAMMIGGLGLVGAAVRRRSARISFGLHGCCPADRRPE